MFETDEDSDALWGYDLLMKQVTRMSQRIGRSHFFEVRLVVNSALSSDRISMIEIDELYLDGMDLNEAPDTGFKIEGRKKVDDFDEGEH